jgi:hypothetical protein
MSDAPVTRHKDLSERALGIVLLAPAALLQQHAKLPVSVFWHWWHQGPYDTSFPDYLPPREGAEPFTRAVAKAHEQGLNAIVYMNQRLWCTNTPSWTREGAEQWAVRERDGQVSELRMQVADCEAALNREAERATARANAGSLKVALAASLREELERVRRCVQHDERAQRVPDQRRRFNAGGVLQRAGQTEAAVDLARLCGLYPAGEGASYAGGILSAGVDGIEVAEAVALSMAAQSLVMPA